MQVGGEAEKLHPYIVATAVFLQSSMHRLVQITDNVEDKQQCFRALALYRTGITQNILKFCQCFHDTVSGSAVPRIDAAVPVPGQVDVVQWLRPDPVRPPFAVTSPPLSSIPAANNFRRFRPQFDGRRLPKPRYFLLSTVNKN